MIEKIAPFQYLTQDLKSHTHAELAEAVCSAGAKWVQLRTKGKSFTEWLKIAQSVKKVTDKFNANLIINDSIDITKAVNAAGVHLGKADESPLTARKALGKKAIIGCTANTIDDIIKLSKQPINYIGVGPFTFTSTKQNLSPQLGLGGYQNIINQIQSLGINIAIIAIGGIQLNDVGTILKTGVHGIAVSSAIHAKGDIQQNTRNFLSTIAAN